MPGNSGTRRGLAFLDLAGGAVAPVTVAREPAPPPARLPVGDYPEEFSSREELLRL
jgi:hypothetical protein